MVMLHFVLQCLHGDYARDYSSSSDGLLAEGIKKLKSSLHFSSP